MRVLAWDETSTVNVTRTSSHQVDKGHSLHMLTETQRASEGLLCRCETLAGCQSRPDDILGSTRGMIERARLCICRKRIILNRKKTN